MAFNLVALDPKTQSSLFLFFVSLFSRDLTIRMYDLLSLCMKTSHFLTLQLIHNQIYLYLEYQIYDFL